MRLTVVCLVLAGNAGSAFAQMASHYREAAAQYRSLGAQACPQDKPCYFANAQYYDCLAQQLSSKGGRCAAPSCQTGHCGGKPNGAMQGGPGGALGQQAPSGLASFNDAAAALNNLLEASERAKAARAAARLSDAQQIYQLEQQRLREMDSFLASANRELQQTWELERDGLNDAQKDQKAERAKEILKSLTQPKGGGGLAPPPQQFPNGLAPADGKANCGPWMTMRDEKGLLVLGLDIAYCSKPSSLAMGMLHDQPLYWMIRNGTGQGVRVQYQLSIQCIDYCKSGWYGFSTDVQANFTFSREDNPFHGWDIALNRIHKVTAL